MRKSVRVRHRGTITIPRHMRRQLELEEGDELAVQVDPAGRLVLTPLEDIPREWAWFHTPGWRKRIAAAEVDLLERRYRDFGSVDEIIRAARS